MKWENQDQQDQTKYIKNIGCSGKKFTVCQQNKNSQYHRDKKIEQLFTIICLERQKTSDDILIPVSGGKYAGDTSNNQYQIDSDKNPICAL